MDFKEETTNFKASLRQKRKNIQKILKRLKEENAGSGVMGTGIFKSEKPLVSEEKAKKSRKTICQRSVSKTPLTEDIEDICLSEEWGNNSALLQVPNLLEAKPKSQPSTEDLHILRQKLLTEEINCGVSDTVLETESSIPRRKHTWSQRSKKMESDWDAVKEKYCKYFISAFAFEKKICGNCRCELEDRYIDCKVCCEPLCNVCDEMYHIKHPFHQRTLFSAKESILLLPTDFVDSQGNVLSKNVPVPCRVPVTCSVCCGSGCLSLVPGSKMLSIITKNGRYDLWNALYSCARCNHLTLASEEDYVKSGWWPGSPSNGTYLFSIDLLVFWNYLSHKTPGTSERKFLETLSAISKRENRVCFEQCSTINRKRFSLANKYYQYAEYFLDTEAYLRNHFICNACADKPLAIHIDGNMKLYRWKSALGENSKALFSDLLISDTATFETHASKIDAVKPKTPKKDTCGSAAYKAGKIEGMSKKGLAQTGVVFSTCRHGVVLRAVDMNKGESYRHVHFLHDHALQAGAKFLCYDVVCLYWPFVKDVARKVEDFNKHFSDMQPFLSRWHGKTHAWYCQVLYSGHWMEGACCTTGETTEQTNSKFSRYGSVTKHMSNANRIDHLTLGAIDWNRDKEESMAKNLVKSYNSAKQDVQWYHNEFDRLTTVRKNKIKELLHKAVEKLKERRIYIITVTSNLAKIMHLPKPIPPEELKSYQKLKQILIETTSEVNILEQEKTKLEESLKKDISLQLDEILIRLKEEADRCKNKQISTKNPLSVSQRSLEGVHLHMVSLKNQISRYADASKQRATLKMQLTKQKEKATKLIEVINRQSGKNTSEVTLEDCYNGIFPWQPAYEVPFRDNFNIVDVWMLEKRSKEEMVRLEFEMNQYSQSLIRRHNALLCVHDLNISSEDSFLRGKANLAFREAKRITKTLNGVKEVFCDIIPEVFTFDHSKKVPIVYDSEKNSDCSSHSDTASFSDCFDCDETFSGYLVCSDSDNNGS